MISNLFSNVKSILGSAQTYSIGEYNVVEEALISEGGYAFVYRVSDVKDKSARYALKKMILQVYTSLKLLRTVRQCKLSSRKFSSGSN